MLSSGKSQMYTNYHKSEEYVQTDNKPGSTVYYSHEANGGFREDHWFLTQALT